MDINFKCKICNSDVSICVDSINLIESYKYDDNYVSYCAKCNQYYHFGIQISCDVINIKKNTEEKAI